MHVTRGWVPGANPGRCHEIGDIVPICVTRSRVRARHAERMTGATPPRRSWADRIRPLRRLVGPIESAQVRRFGRSGLSVIFRTPVLVLETVGRRTGATRSTPLAYHRCGDGSLVLVAGAGGQTQLPDWVANLRANPDVIVVIDRTRVALQAVELRGADHDSMWTEISRVSSRIDVYARRAGRRAPVFRLEPRAESPQM